MNIATLIKSTLSVATSISVGSLVGNAIKSTTPAGATFIKRASIGFGSMVLSGMVAHYAALYVEGMVDTAVETTDEMFSKIRLRKEEAEVDNDDRE